LLGFADDAIGSNLTEGSFVHDGDDDGNVCEARVIAVGPRELVLTLNYGTFQAKDSESSLLV